MKRAALLVLAALILLLTACGAEETVDTFRDDLTAAEVLDAALSLFEQDGMRFRSDAGEDDAEYLEPERAGYFFYGDYDAAVDFGGEWAMFIGNGATVFEIDVIRTGSAEASTALLNARMAAKDNGSLETYEPEMKAMLEEGRVVRWGDYTVLLVTPDNDAADAAVRSAATK